jgi:hypothetical protein
VWGKSQRQVPGAQHLSSRSGTLAEPGSSSPEVPAATDAAAAASVPRAVQFLLPVCPSRQGSSPPTNRCLVGQPSGKEGGRGATNHESGIRGRQNGVGGGRRRDITSYGRLSHAHRGCIATAATRWALETIGILFQEAFGGRRAV